MSTPPLRLDGLASKGEWCPCGLPLHYTDPQSRVRVQRIVDRLGPMVKVVASTGKAWTVPRHYVALHGVHPSDIARRGRTNGIRGGPVRATTACQLIKGDPSRVRTSLAT